MPPVGDAIKDVRLGESPSGYPTLYLEDPLAMRTDFLFAMPSWLSGAARVIDTGGQFDEYNESANGAEADAKALFADWRIVGESLVSVMKAFRLELQTQDPQTE